MLREDMVVFDRDKCSVGTDPHEIFFDVCLCVCACVYTYHSQYFCEGKILHATFPEREYFRSEGEFSVPIRRNLNRASFFNENRLLPPALRAREPDLKICREDSKLHVASEMGRRRRRRRR